MMIPHWQSIGELVFITSVTLTDCRDRYSMIFKCIPYSIADVAQLKACMYDFILKKCMFVILSDSSLQLARELSKSKGSLH